MLDSYKLISPGKRHRAQRKENNAQSPSGYYWLELSWSWTLHQKQRGQRQYLTVLLVWLSISISSLV